MSVRPYPAFKRHSVSVTVARTGILAMLICFGPAVASAQNESHFLVGASFTPKWNGNQDLNVTVGWEGALEGSEFTIGAGRGSTFGGDWTVNYVSKPIKDQTTVEEEGDCESGSCYTSTITSTTQDVVLRGMEFLWTGNFVTIKRRVQIGVIVGGGYAKPRGTVTQTFDFVNTTTFGGRTTTFTDSFTEELPASEVFYSIVPLFTAEAQVGFIVAPSFKIKVSGGLNNPGYGVRISGVYLIGA